MGKANRVRRKRKLKDREREHKRRLQTGERAHSGAAADAQAGFPRPTPAEAAEQLVDGAIAALFDDDRDVFGVYVSELGATLSTSWPRIVGRAVWARLERAVTTGWDRGWQPAEVVRQVERTFGAQHARLATDVIAGQMRRYAAATIEERWETQLTALGAEVWWDRDDSYLDCWQDREHVGRAAAISCALDVLFALMRLPGLAVLCPLPGTARRADRAAGKPGERPADQRMLARVRALLAKAESTEFAEEAEALTARAQQLMAKHSIDEALLAAAAADASGRPGLTSGVRLFIDNPYEHAKAVLLQVIATANRCRAIWMKNLGMSTVVGFPADLQAVELLFTSLLVQATSAMLAAGSRRDAYGQSRTRAFRQSFLAAFAHRIGERLAEATGAAEQEAAAESAGANLLPVLAARHRAVDEAFEAMFPSLRTSWGLSATDSEGWFAGRAAADMATLQHRREVTGDAA
ncbi:MAG: DUF2786 domain-containing protein [Actinobacteria bacterium]|nr:DUF2786 domain-containing protein [Actinomycetota bacterium]